MTDSRTGAKIGVLVPFTNTNLEPDLALLCPPGVTTHFTRLGGYDADEIPDSDQMADLGAADISTEVRLISGVRPDVVLYGCTSATLTHGTGFDQKLSRMIRESSGATSMTAAGSLVEALQAINTKKIGFASPYVGEINDQAMGFFASAGFDSANCADIGRALGNYGQGELTPDEVYALALRADHPDADAIVLSCTDMRAVEVVERVEAALNKPVITSNQAMMFGVMRALSLPRHAGAPGRLFDRLKTY